MNDLPSTDPAEAVTGSAADAVSARDAGRQRAAAVRDRLTRVDAAVFALVAVGCVFTTWAMMKAPTSTGVWQDDGIYLVTSKSIADGHGYRRPELPGNPWQTKYPVLYPLALSAVWKVWPKFPDNVTVVRVFHGAFMFLGLVFCHLALRRSWRMPDWLAGGASVAAAFNAGWKAVIETPMSEALFLPLMGLTLWASTPRFDSDRSGSRRPGEWGRTFVAAFSAATAYLTRTIGVTLIAAVVISCLWRRRWREAAVSAVIGAAAVGGWQAWVRSADAANASIPARQALDYELGYGRWVPRDVGAAMHVAWQNTAAMAYAIYDALARPPADGSLQPRLRGERSGLPLYIPMIAACVLLVFGLAITFSSAAPAVHLFLASYLLLTAVWPFSPARFLQVIYPFIVAGIVAGMFVPVAALVRSFAAASEPRPLLRRLRADGLSRFCRAEPSAASAVALAVAISAGAIVLQHVAVTRAIAGVDHTNRLMARDSLVELIRRKTPPDAVIACGHAGYYHLLTGRRAVMALAMDDPIALLYGEQRVYRHCGVIMTPAEEGEIGRWVASSLRAYHRAAGVTHFVVGKQRQLYDDLYRQQVRSNPSYWPMVGECRLATLHRFVP